MKKLITTTLLIFFLLTQAYSQEKNSVSLEIRVSGVRNNYGHVSIALFKGNDGFPEESGKAYILQVSEIINGNAKFLINSLSPGEYAFAILHDEDMDGKMDKNIFGIPKEGFAFSRNFKPRVGAPDFEDVSITVNHQNLEMDVEIIYYL